MKARTPFSLAALGCFLALALVFSAPETKAQGTITVTVDEQGNGTIVNSATGTFNLASSMQSDPGPGGRPSVLNYNLLSPPGLVGGDVLLLDLTSLVSDVIRFNPTFLGGSLFFYSVAGGSELADVGLPTAFNTNLVSILENEGGFTLYTPTAGQPGFVGGAAFPVTYRFLSGVSAVPETGSTLILLGLAVTTLFIVQRRRARA